MKEEHKNKLIYILILALLLVSGYNLVSNNREYKSGFDAGVNYSGQAYATGLNATIFVLNTIEKSDSCMAYMRDKYNSDLEYKQQADNFIAELDKLRVFD